MKKLTVIFTVISLTLAFSVLLSGCLVLPTIPTEPTSPPAMEPEPTPEPEPEPAPAEPGETAPMEDMTCTLESYGHRGSTKTLLADTEITAEFKSASSTVVGSGGCNGYFASYEIDNDRLTIIPPIGATEMACSPPPIMDQEQEYFTLLETAETFLIHNEKLIISCSANKEMVFVKKTTEEEIPPEEIPPIEDMAWQLEAYGDRGSLKDLVGDTKITAEFKSAEGQIVGSSGCNGYSVDYEIDNYELSIAPSISTTMMLCFPSAVMEQEHEYFELLKAAETFQVDDDRLIISCSGNRELVFIAP
jgi:heat shock protein HslJ